MLGASTSILFSRRPVDRDAEREAGLGLRLRRRELFPEGRLVPLGLRRRGGGEGDDRASEGVLLRRRGGLSLLFLRGGLTLRLLGYPRAGGDLERLAESERDRTPGERRRRLAGGLRLSLSRNLRFCSRTGGVKEGERGLRRAGGGERDTVRERARLGGDLRGGDRRLTGSGDRESRDGERRRGGERCLRIGTGERELLMSDGDRRRGGGEREMRRPCPPLNPPGPGPPPLAPQPPSRGLPPRDRRAHV